MQERRERPTLTRLTRLRFVNAYLVDEGPDLTLVDTLVKGSAEGIVAAAGRIGKPIARIVLTHAHGDHAGSLDALAERLPDAEISCSEREAPLMAGDHSLRANEPQSKLKGSWPTVATKPHRTLVEGDRVGSLRVVAAPGHTPGHIALLDERDLALIAGDAYSTLGGISTTGHTNWRFPLPAM